MKKILLAASALALTATASHAWWNDNPPSTDMAVQEQMETLLREGERQTGLPTITEFSERRAVKFLYELRDEPEYRTYTYLFVPMTGQLVKLCDSMGYGINASIQYSNPERAVDLEDELNIRREGNGLTAMPQAEPNGLFMPEGLAATYVLCINEGDDAEAEPVKAVYIEPEIIVSPFPLQLQ